MSRSRTLTLPGLLPRAIAVLVAMSMVAEGFGLPPVPVPGLTIPSDDDPADSQPCEESPDESPEDEESSAGKHPAALGCGIAIAPPAVVAYGVFAPSSRLHAGPLDSSAPIRGPPAAA